MHLRDRAIRVGGFRRLPLRKPRLCNTNINPLYSTYASELPEEQPYALHSEERQISKTTPKPAAKRRFEIPLNTKDIFVNDLRATLEAHRDTNRAKVIRKIGRPPPEYKDKDYKRLAGIHEDKKDESRSPHGADVPQPPTARPAGPEETPEGLRNPKNRRIIRPIGCDSNEKRISEQVRLIRLTEGGPVRRKKAKVARAGSDKKSELRSTILRKVFAEIDEPKLSGEVEVTHGIGKNQLLSNQPWMDYVGFSDEDGQTQ